MTINVRRFSAFFSFTKAPESSSPEALLTTPCTLPLFCATTGWTSNAASTATHRTARHRLKILTIISSSCFPAHCPVRFCKKNPLTHDSFLGPPVDTFYSGLPPISMNQFDGVMSSCLCKSVEGAVFPLWIHPVKDREHDAVHALEVDEANHRSGSSPDLDEAALDNVGGAQLFPEVSGEVEEAEQLRQVALQLAHDAGIGLPPAGLEVLEGALRPAQSLGLVDGLGVGLDRAVVALPHLLQDVAHFVHPAALMRDSGIDGLQRGGQPGAAVGDDELQILAF